ncbi:MAG TPA: hypothetical protein VKO43_01460, partial [Candidatus Krumholzibacteriaceae bacterium]|nr:hypothetical protein [Candidatus Krumholzibacteriaceae bacterium]
MKKISALFLAFFMIFTFIFSSAANSQSETVEINVKIALELYELFTVDTLSLSGPLELEWTELEPGTTESERDTTNLTGFNPELGRIKLFDGELPTIGQSIEIDPGTDFPAESFFDVFTKIELPDLLPGDTLIHYTPLHIEDIIDDMPPLFDKHFLTNGPIILHNTAGDPVGEIHYWEEEMIPYSEPEPYLDISTYYGSDIVKPDATGMIQVSLGIAGDFDPEYVSFFWRHADTPEPFIEFWMDMDGNSTSYSTIYPLGDGDGWTGYLDGNIFDPAGEDIEFSACAYSPEGNLCDSLTLTVDPTPPFSPIIVWPPDSLGLFFADSLFPVTCLHLDEDPDTVKLALFPLTEKHRDLTPVDQLKLGTAVDTVACAPTAAASCFDYFARNGYPKFAHPGGDTNKPQQSPSDIAKELVKTMETENSDTVKGTKPEKMYAGIKQYIKDHGMEGWTTGVELTNNYSDIGEMFREFEADEEDVMLKLTDSVSTNGGKEAIGHWVTL